MNKERSWKIHNHVLGNCNIFVSEAWVESGVEHCEGEEVTNGFEIGFGFRFVIGC